jgi:hypothetical protein
MSRRPHTVGRPAAAQGGFALLVLLGLVGIGSVGVVLAVQAFVPAAAETPQRAERHLATAAAGARAALRAHGSLPPDLDGIAAAAGLDPDGAWRVDPWAAPQPIDVRAVASGLRLRSRGPDRRLGTADDMRVDVPAEPIVRARQRGRLRLQRALLLRSPFASAVSMTAADLDAMRAALRAYAIARRKWWTADTAQRVTLQATLSASAATIAALRTAHACLPLPGALCGAGGLLERLGLPDTCGVDGAGRPFVADPVLGLAAVGCDGVEGTDDDM